jgi:erythromycin esterase
MLAVVTCAGSGARNVAEGQLSVGVPASAGERSDLGIGRRERLPLVGHPPYIDPPATHPFARGLIVPTFANSHWRAASRALMVAATVMSLACSSDASAPTAPPPPSPEPEFVEWLKANIVPFETVGVRDDRTDLEGLDEIIGDARIVALGEATHGTSEFFRMKHRILDYLVREKGFTLFAMEASWPEMNRIDDWVKGRRPLNEAAMLLSGQYFWTWNTSSVLDLLFWARDFNEMKAGGEPVSVLGFDMQFPGMAIHNVVTYLGSIDPPGATFAAASYECVDANDPRGAFAAWYADRDASYQIACRSEINSVFDYLSANRAALQAASSSRAFALAQQSARLVQQFEDMTAQRVPSARDVYMAENVDWLLAQAPTGTKAVLWAHNYHVGDMLGTMGSHLRQSHGSDLVAIGFDFDHGWFTAGTITEDQGWTGLAVHRVGPAPEGSYESFFRAAGEPRFILDMRGVGLGTPATTWLAGPRRFRSIGAGYSPGNPDWFFQLDRLPSLFDVVIFIRVSTASNVLLSTPPSQF